MLKFKSLAIALLLSTAVLLPASSYAQEGGLSNQCRSLLAFYGMLQDWIIDVGCNGVYEGECLVLLQEAIWVWNDIQMYCPPGNWE